MVTLLNFSANALLDSLEKNPKQAEDLIGITYDQFWSLVRKAQSLELGELSKGLSTSNQLLLLLLCLNQAGIEEVANRLQVSESAVLGLQFGASESDVDEFIFRSGPLLDLLASSGLIKRDLIAASRRALTATRLASDQQKSLKLCRSLGFSPSYIYDIGASNGSWTRVAEEIFPEACFHLFEPLAVLSSSYRSVIDYLNFFGINYTLHSFALGAENGTKEIFITPDLVGSSLLVEQRSDFFPSSVSVETMTLDKAVSTLALPLPQAIKIDTQGYELEILKGATETLKHVELLILECWLARAYGPATPLLGEIAAWLVEHDFVLFDFAGGYRNTANVLICQDCLFVRRSGSFAGSIPI